MMVVLVWLALFASVLALPVTFVLMLATGELAWLGGFGVAFVVGGILSALADKLEK